jgi:hypothetical protein
MADRNLPPVELYKCLPHLGGLFTTHKKMLKLSPTLCLLLLLLPIEGLASTPPVRYSFILVFFYLERKYSTGI